MHIHKIVMEPIGIFEESLKLYDVEIIPLKGSVEISGTTIQSDNFALTYTNSNSATMAEAHLANDAWTFDLPTFYHRSIENFFEHPEGEAHSPVRGPYDTLRWFYQEYVPSSSIRVKQQFLSQLLTETEIGALQEATRIRKRNEVNTKNLYNIASSVRALIDYANTPGLIASEEYNLATNELLILVTQSNLSGFNTNRLKSRQRIFKDAVWFISETYHKDITLADIANSACTLHKKSSAGIFGHVWSLADAISEKLSPGDV